MAGRFVLNVLLAASKEYRLFCTVCTPERMDSMEASMASMLLYISVPACRQVSFTSLTSLICSKEDVVPGSIIIITPMDS